ncbi:MAG: hypothetical protein H7331_07275 [Bacteroidia bacterium]|nr:hypothetical protein [Bacteroidia bacterium]
MLKPLFSIFFCVFTGNVLAQSFDYFSDEAWVMQHKIKNVVGTTYNLNNGALVLPGKKSTYKKFNPQGILLENITYSLGGEAVREETNIVDENNYITETRLYEAHKSTNTKVYYKKTSVGTIAEKLIVKSSKAFEKYIYKYNSKLQLIACDLYDSEFGYTRITYTYDANANIIKTNEYNAYNELYTITTFTYNDNNQLIECVALGADSEVDYKYAYTYNLDITVQWQTTYSPTGKPLQITKYNYNFY